MHLFLFFFFVKKKKKMKRKTQQTAQRKTFTLILVLNFLSVFYLFNNRTEHQERHIEKCLEKVEGLAKQAIRHSHALVQ